MGQFRLVRHAKEETRTMYSNENEVTSPLHAAVAKEMIKPLHWLPCQRKPPPPPRPTFQF